MEPDISNQRERPGTKGRRKRRRVLTWLFGTALLLFGLAIALTDRAPLVAPPDPPRPGQASAARDVANQLLDGQLPGSQAAPVRLTPNQLAAVSALASDGFKPDRFLIAIDGDSIDFAGSHKLFSDRWLNVRLEAQDNKEGFPKVDLTIGSVWLPSWLSRLFLDTARLVLNLRGANLPALDTLIQSSEIKNNQALMMVHLPLESSVLDRFSTGQSGQAASDVLGAYCKLTELQAKEPTDDLATMVRRAFPPGTAGTASSNRAALVAIAMLDVSPRVGQLVGLSDQDVKRCAGSPFLLKLNGRTDLSEHWSLSAALAVTTGTQFSEAMGEWKELADSVSRASRLAQGDPSGFSFLDLAADRSGFRIAQAATNDDSAKSVATAMSRIDQNDILPATLMGLEDGLPEKDFAEKYGTIRDPRFRAKIHQIDGELHKAFVN